MAAWQVVRPYKCVCKQLRSLLTTPVFNKMRLHHVNNQNHHKQLFVPTTRTCKYFQTINCENLRLVYPPTALCLSKPTITQWRFMFTKSIHNGGIQ
ncbi:hypothetical protein OSB04_028659 [Centaurea solstitialis]|uniref:Uncharacterized protein n=1 Tax=Centaurea solstitialis TaxID=347529 RepID=A0AA38T0Z5_9ASTR|nr:hypothetical protein OSB04_028659 [Centaurea solstitialis]